MAQLPVGDFLKARLKEYDPTFELRSGTGFEALFFKPLQFIVQPMRDEAATVFTSQSLLRILLTDTPDTYNEYDVDDIVANTFTFRNQGGYSAGIARAFYNVPLNKEFSTGSAVFTGSNGLTYSNQQPFIITLAQMEVQLSQGLYYMDIPVQSDTKGVTTALGVGGLVSLAGDVDVVSVTNLSPISGGLDKETNTAFINRAQQSIGVRDLVAEKGFKAILFENFQANLLESQPIGFGDGEMMRDILYNTHMGGRVDGWVKTSSITTGYKNFVGVLTDQTRQTYASKNVILSGVTFQSLGNTSVDRTNNHIPLVQEIKPSYPGQFISTVDLSTPVNLSVNQHIKVEVDGVIRNIRIAGAIPAATTRNEIVNLINNAFGYVVAFAFGNFIKIRSLSQGLTSLVVLDNPDFGNSALMVALGLSTVSVPHAYPGDGPVTFVEGTHYNIVDIDGTIQRVVGPVVLAAQTSGVTALNSFNFSDATSNIFINILPRDILTITTGADAGDYRVLSKTSNNTLVLDKKLTATASSIHYLLTRTGIKSGELIYVSYYYNPLSIDIGNQAVLDTYGRVRGLRPGRDVMTITDLPLLRITSIDEIDPLTLEPTGTVLIGKAGYGQGGYGKHAYGIGSGGQYRMVVNVPTYRFSMYEDSYIVLDKAIEGLSFRVNYEYVPEIGAYHTFVQSPSERVLDGDILIKHFIPAYVSGNITYSVAASNSTAPNNVALTALVKDYINKIPSSTAVQFSDVMQFILKQIDPFSRYNCSIIPFTLSATVHNTDGTTASITGTSQLTIPTYTPIFTTKPLSARTAHWIADNIILTRV